MHAVFSSKRLAPILLLVLLAPSTSASHDPDAPAAYLAVDNLYRIEHDPWSGGSWLAGNGLFFHGDDGGFSYIGIREGLPINKVHDLAPTPTGLWLYTDLGPAVMDKSDGSFHTVQTDAGDRFLHAGRSVSVEDGAVWLGTDEQGLFRVDPTSLVATPVPNPINGSRFQHPVMDVAADGDLLFISATGYGLVEWDRSTGETRHFDVAFLEERPIYGRILVSPSDAWIATSGDGVVMVDRATGTSTEYTGPYTVNARTIYGLARVGNEHWFATDAGVSRYDARTDSWQYWQGLPGNGNDVTVIDGEVHVITNQGFVLRYDRASDDWLDAHWWDRDKLLPYNSVFGCTTDGGDLLVSTGGGGVVRHPSGARSWQRVGDPDNRTARPLDILVWETVASPEHVWFASHKGISILDRASGSWGHVRTDERAVGHIVDNPVRDLHVDEDGAWAATMSHTIVRGPEKGEEQPGNLAHWDRERNVWTRYTQNSGLAGDSVRSIDVLDGRVWVGFEEAGLDVLDAASGEIRHVWPTDGSEVHVLSVVARPDAVWVGASTGLHRVDPVTLEVTKVPGLPEQVVSSLFWDDGRLWVGAILGGLHRYDPASGAVDPFTTGNAVDATPNCMVRDGDLLYVGTQWGLERLDVERGLWLPQDGSGDVPSISPSIQITAPAAGEAYAPGDAVTLRGTAKVPKGAWVEVGVGGEWVRATGTGSWSARFPIDASFSGTLQLSARVFDGQRTLVQDAVRITVGGAAETTGPSFSHEQVLLAQNGSTLPFVVTFEPEDADVTGWVELLPPSASETVTVPLETSAPGVLSGTSPVLEDAGEATYVLHLQWTDGQTRLPSPYSGSASYKVVVQEPKGKPIGFLTLVRCDAGIAPGASGEVTFGVQNTGTRGGLMEVDFAGPASAWITEEPEPFELPPSHTHFLRVPVAVPEGTSFGKHDLAIGAGPVERTAGSVHVFTCGLLVGEAEETQSGQNGTAHDDPAGGAAGRGAPHPGILLVLVALAVARLRRG